jgi:NitT/TauT family transport system substrate-binding protein
MNSRNTPRGKWIALSVLILVGISVIAYLATLKRSTARQKRVVIAQVGDFFLYAPIYVALDAGYFRDQGLDVEIVSTGGDDKTWAAVLGGSAMFGVGDPTFVAVSSERGQGGAVVGSIVNGVPFWGITFKNIQPIDSGASLNGFTVATFPAPSTAFTLQQKMFRDAGLVPKIREAAFGAIIPALKAGQADIGLELEPNVSQAQHDGATVVYSLATIYGDFAMTGLTATDKLLHDDPDTIRKTTSAIQRGLDTLHNDPERALEVLIRRFPGIERQVAKSALERVLRDNVVPRSVIVSRAAWDKAVKLRQEAGDLKTSAPYEKFVFTLP